MTSELAHFYKRIVCSQCLNFGWPLIPCIAKGTTRLQSTKDTPPHNNSIHLVCRMLCLHSAPLISE